jgi:hypothetical protein
MVLSFSCGEATATSVVVHVFYFPCNFNHHQRRTERDERQTQSDQYLFGSLDPDVPDAQIGENLDHSDQKAIHFAIKLTVLEFWITYRSGIPHEEQIVEQGILLER